MLQTFKSVLLVESLTIYDKDNSPIYLDPGQFYNLIDVRERDRVSVKFKYNDKAHWCFRGDLFAALNGQHHKYKYANNTPLIGSLLYYSSDLYRVSRYTSSSDLVVRNEMDGHLSTIPYASWYYGSATIQMPVHEIYAEDQKTESIAGQTVKVYPRTKVVNKQELAAFKKHLDKFDTLAFDTETTGLLQKIYTLDDREDFVVCFTISTSPDNGYYIHNDKSQEFRDFLEYLCTKHLVMHNAAFDLGVLKAVYQLEPKSFDDTMIIYKCLDDSLMSYGLKSLTDSVSSRGTQLKLDDFNYLEYVELGMYSDIENIASYYACYDTSNTYLLYNKALPEIKKNAELYKYYRDTEIASIIPVSVAINTNGLKVDIDEIKSLDVQVRDHLSDLYAQMTVITQPVVDRLNNNFKAEQETAQKQYRDEAIQFLKNKNVIKTTVEEKITETLLLNCNYEDQPRYDKIKTLAVFHNRLSTRQCGIKQYSLELNNKAFMELLLYSPDGMDLPMQLSATGKASVNKVAINELTKYIVANEADKPELAIAKDFFKLLSEYIKTKKLLEAFITPTLETIKDVKDGKLHPNYNLFGTVSSRASCNNPNFQQLASNKKFDIRKAFIVDDKDQYSFVQCDFNAQELRVMAALSQDPTLLHIIHNGIDPHCETVRRVWTEHADKTDEYITVTLKHLRTIAKVVMFSLAYGARAKKMAFILGIPEHEAEKVLTAFKQDAYPVLTKWLEDAGKEIEEKGYADIHGGYRRRFISSGNKWHDAAQIRSIVNSLIQGASAYITKVCTLNTLRALDDSGIDYKLVILIHDSITLQFRDEDIARATPIVEKYMNYDFDGVPVNSVAAINKDMSKETEMGLADFLNMLEDDE